MSCCFPRHRCVPHILPGHPGDARRGIGCAYLSNDFLQEVEASGHSRDDPVYAVEPDVIRKKGEHLLCLRDRRLGTSYVDAVTGDAAGKAEYMLSYSWGYSVGSIADTLSAFFSGSKVQQYIWICCLCINQHRVKEAQKLGKAVPFSEFEAAFGQRVRGASHILAMMSPWQSPVYIQRVWCVFEISRAMSEQKQLSILMPPKEEVAFRGALFSSGLQGLFDALAALRIQDAAASVPEDKANILKSIDPDATDFDKSRKVAELNKNVREKLQAWLVETAATWLEQQLPDEEVQLEVHNAVGELLIETVADFERAERILSAGMRQHGVQGLAGVSALRLMGRRLVRQGDWPEAERYYRQAEEELEKCGGAKTIQHAQLQIDLFLCSGQVAQLDLAKRTFEELEATQSEAFARVLKHLGTVSLNKGDRDKALHFYERSKSCYQQTGLKFSPGYADLLMNLGRMQASGFLREEALTTFAEAREVYQAIGVTSSPGYADLLVNIGHIEVQEKLEQRPGGERAELASEMSQLLSSSKPTAAQ
ncbi:unnamed protein product [Effrenium voratum]|nr:unnamed protein product [Effrenium voratum]